MSAWIAADWPAPPCVHALTTMRLGLGVSQSPFDSFNLGLRNGDDPEAAMENRRRLEAALDLPSPPRWLRQVHGTNVARFDGPHPNPPPQAGEGGERAARAGGGNDVPPQAGEGGERAARAGGGNDVPPQAGEGEQSEPEADAATTSVPGNVLAILTADCLPVAFAAKDGSEVAVAHAGWRGLVAGVLEATVAAMTTSPENIVAWLGPAAGPDAYEIGAEVFDAFALCDPRAETAFVPARPGHWRVDLYALARQRLADVGVVDVHGGGLCTISDPARFFSHRRSTLDGSGRTGRMAMLAWMQ